MCPNGRIRKGLGKWTHWEAGDSGGASAREAETLAGKAPNPHRNPPSEAARRVAGLWLTSPLSRPPLPPLSLSLATPSLKPVTSSFLVVRLPGRMRRIRSVKNLLFCKSNPWGCCFEALISNFGCAFVQLCILLDFCPFFLSLRN